MAGGRNKQRTYARNRMLSRRGKELVVESDGQYLLKLVLVVLLGTLWLKFAQPISLFGLPLGGFPLGMCLGLLLVGKFERYQFNRKLWYLVLIVVTIISYFVPAGVII